MEKTLIFGGAFDPVHKEHVAMCKSAMQELGISKLVLVPTVTPPHKSAGFLSFQDRCDLLKVAFEGVDFVIDDIENAREKDNYSALTLPILKEKYGDIVYLIGGDSLEYLDTWYHPEKIVQVCPIAVCAREGYDDIRDRAKRLEQKFGGEFILLNYVGKDVSSSEVRAKLLMGETPIEIDERVLDAIRRKRLFCEYEDMAKKTSFLSNGRVVRTQQSGRFDGDAAQLFAQLEAGFHQSVSCVFFARQCEKASLSRRFRRALRRSRNAGIASIFGCGEGEARFRHTRRRRA